MADFEELCKMTLGELNKKKNEIESDLNDFRAESREKAERILKIDGAIHSINWVLLDLLRRKKNTEIVGAWLEYDSNWTGNWKNLARWGYSGFVRNWEDMESDIREILEELGRKKRDLEDETNKLEFLIGTNEYVIDQIANAKRMKK